MICPYCQSEMTKGCVQCRDGVYWTPKSAFVSALSGLKKGGISLRNDPGLPSNTSVTYLCPKCRKVIIDIK